MPEKCPICHCAIDASVLQTVATFERDFVTITRIQVLFRCPRAQCDRLFLGIYEGPQKVTPPSAISPWRNLTVTPSEVKTSEFENPITKVSPQFVAIYHQSEIAESHGLDLICGAGYRKSLEFLLKDFLKSINKGKEEYIEQKQIGPLIQEFMPDPRLKAAASRAAWLGNDETHYVRKWETKDLSALKKLIDLTVHWISQDILTREFETSMPHSGPAKAEAKAGE